MSMLLYNGTTCHFSLHVIRFAAMTKAVVLLVIKVLFLLHCSKGNIIDYKLLIYTNEYLTSRSITGVKVGFSELDYAANEGDGKAAVLVMTQAEPIKESITVPIMAITFEEFFGSGRTLPTDFDLVDLPDPAECKYIAACIAYF